MAVRLARSERSIMRIDASAPLPVTLRDSIPQGDPLVRQTGQAGRIVHRLQINPQYGAQQPPELVARIGIILSPRQRLRTWQRPKHENARIGPKHRGKPAKRYTVSLAD